MKRYLIAAAVIRDRDRILLVQQQSKNDPSPSWALPGGVVENGELLHEALKREVREETGLIIDRIGNLIYSIHHDDTESSTQSLAYIFEIDQWHGDLHTADPDNMVLRLDFLPQNEVIEKLNALPWRYMHEPIVVYLCGEVPQGSVWLYRNKNLIERL